MSIKHALYDKIFSSIINNNLTVVLTPNRRLSATLNQHYQALQISLNNKMWHTPTILPITTWFETLWQKNLAQSFSHMPMLLKPIQEQFIWKEIISNAKQSEQLIKAAECAEMIQSSRKLLHEWRVDLEQSVFKASADSMALIGWCKLYDELCHINNWIDNARLPDELIKLKLDLPKNIILYGFTELSPQFKYFFDYASECGSTVTLIESINVNANEGDSNSLIHQQHDTYRCFATLNQDHEIYSIAEWARNIYQKSKCTDDLIIGCVVPNLDKIRNRIAQIFAEVFREDTTVFNISAGKKLTQYPIISAVFQILALSRSSLNPDLIWFVLSSPFIGNVESEQVNRAQFDFWLREQNIAYLDISKQAHLALFAKYCPKLALRLEQFFIYLRKVRHLHLYPSEWSHHFNTMLTIMGWPGERSLNSEEFQTVDNWLQLLANFALLDEVITQKATSTNTSSCANVRDSVNNITSIAKDGKLSIFNAIQSLQNFANKHIFQPKTPDAPIQILGVLEAAAIPFDYVWLAGMDDVNWPPQPKPNPFIPKQLQRMLHMPHATAERELSYCQKLLFQFKSSARHLIFSYAEKKDEVECQPSSLINVKEVKSYTSIDKPIINRIYATKELDILYDETAQLFKQKENLRGGVNVLNDQALCPFRAFAKWRLHAKNLGERKFGMRAKDRGNIIHKILELIWRNLNNHHSLITFPDSKFDQFINECIDEGLIAPLAFSHRKRYLFLEKQRLKKLISHWLAIEKARDPFKIIATEKSFALTLGQFKIDIKIDRIDQLENGGHLIIDYKTGKYNDTCQWFDERPTDIQLPLYALINKQKTEAISFAEITSKASSFKGVSKHSLAIKGIKAFDEINHSNPINWQTQLQTWQNVFTQLADDFYSGRAKVDPKNENTCTFCDLKPVCRLHEEVNCDHI